MTLCKDKRKHAIEIINCEERKCYLVIYAKKKLLMNVLMMKVIVKFEITVITQESIEVPHIVSVI